MAKLDKDIAVTGTSNASKKNEYYFENEMESDQELSVMVSKVLDAVGEFKASYAKKERALNIANELLFLKLTNSRQN